jgi:hypothetical protein
MLTTWRALQNFAATADAYLNQQKNETKLAYAIKRVRDQITRHSEKLQQLMLDVEIDLCVVDAEGVIKRDALGNLQFTREGLKARNEQQRALLEHEFDVEPFFVDTPLDLTADQIAAFGGLIIPLATNGGPPEAHELEEAQASATN